MHSQTDKTQANFGSKSRDEKKAAISSTKKPDQPRSSENDLPGTDLEK